MIRRSTVMGVALLAIVAAPAQADIYKFVDTDGRAHFSDVRLDARTPLRCRRHSARSRGLQAQRGHVDHQDGLALGAVLHRVVHQVAHQSIQHPLVHSRHSHICYR